MCKIAVIVPSRNREQCIRDLLTQLKTQTVHVSEIIVVDQSDEPYANLSCDVVIRMGASGPAVAKNIGAARAAADVLVFLDDDVSITTSTIQKLCDPIVKGECAAATAALLGPMGDYAYMNCDEYYMSGSRSWLRFLTSNPSFPGETNTMSFAGGCSAIRRSVFDAIGAFDTWFDPDGAGEDREFGLRLYKAGVVVKYVHDAGIVHLRAPRGGRRDGVGAYRVYPLEIGLLYICKKHFSTILYRQYSIIWLYEYAFTRSSGSRLSPYVALSRCYNGLKALRSMRSISPHASEAQS